jgi:hypothetical protein
LTRTNMVKLATTFIAATSTIRVRMMNIITFSTSRALTKRVEGLPVRHFQVAAAE